MRYLSLKRMGGIFLILMAITLLSPVPMAVASAPAQAAVAAGAGAALADTGGATAIVSENFESIFTVIGLVLTFLFPAVGGLWARNRAAVRGLLRVIDGIATVPNREFKAKASEYGLKAAQGALDALKD